MAGLAVPGLIAGTGIFIASFFGLTMDKPGPKALLLHLGVFTLFIPLVAVERWSKGVDPFRGKPRWALRAMQVFFVLFLGVFFTFLVLSHAASPKNHQWRICLVSPRWKSRTHLRARLSLREKLGIKGICYRLDSVLRRTHDALVVSSTRRVDCGHA